MCVSIGFSRRISHLISHCTHSTVCERETHTPIPDCTEFSILPVLCTAKQNRKFKFTKFPWKIGNKGCQIWSSGVCTLFIHKIILLYGAMQRCVMQSMHCVCILHRQMCSVSNNVLRCTRQLNLNIFQAFSCSSFHRQGFFYSFFLC